MAEDGWMIQILPRLYIGNKRSTFPIEIKANDINVLVTAVPDAFHDYPTGVYVARVPDDPHVTKYGTLLSEIIDYIERHRTGFKRKILVACTDGKSFSPGLVIAYLMKHKNFSYDTSLGLVKNRIPDIKISDTYLKIIEIEFQARKSIIKTKSDEEINLRTRSYSRSSSKTSVIPRKSFSESDTDSIEMPPLYRSISDSGIDPEMSGSYKMLESPRVPKFASPRRLSSSEKKDSGSGKESGTCLFSSNDSEIEAAEKRSGDLKPRKKRGSLITFFRRLRGKKDSDEKEWDSEISFDSEPGPT